MRFGRYVIATEVALQVDLRINDLLSVDNIILIYIVMGPLLPEHPAVQQFSIALDPANDILVRDRFNIVDHGHSWSLHVRCSSYVVLEEVDTFGAQACQ